MPTYNLDDMDEIWYDSTNLDEVYYDNALVWQKICTTPITVSGSNERTGDATVYDEVQKSFDKNLQPYTATMEVDAWDVRSTWHGPPTVQLWLYNVSTKAWELIVSKTKDTDGQPPWNVDITSVTSGKWYNTMKMRYGGCSNNGKIGVSGRISLTSYKKKI